MARTVSLILGLAFVLLGIAAAFTGSHAHQFAGFGVNGLHNWVHILTGALGLLAYAAGEVRSRQFCIFVSAAYGLVTVLGFAGVDAVTDSMNINTADNWLHAFITGVALWGALSSSVPAAKIHRRRDFDDNDFRRAA